MSESEETVGQRLKRLRLARGLSQRELAVKGVSYAYISRIEAGTRTPSVKALRKLATGLNVSAEYLESGVELTTTDARAEALLMLTSGGLHVEIAREKGEDGTWRVKHGPAAVALSFSYDGETRTVPGASLSAALGLALRWITELSRLRVARERIAAEEAVLLSGLPRTVVPDADRGDERSAGREAAC